MSKHLKITIAAALILIIINLIPFKTGPTVGGYCGMVYQQQTLSVFGLPFGYLQNTTHTGCGFALLKRGWNTFNVNNHDSLGYDNYHFKASAFVADAAIAVIILGLVYVASKKRRK